MVSDPDPDERSERQDAGGPGSGSTPLTVVGIGASAGGLNALKELFAAIPPDSGLAYVVVVHLSPEHESFLADLLQPIANIPVEQVTELSLLEADHVYVIPPNRNLSTIDTHLRLSDLEENRRERAPIDHFFRTLADTHDGASIGVILTGTGSDGSLGLRRIKEQGGITVVQDPAEAEYDGMPQSAIATGAVDLILPVREIPGNILRLARSEPQLQVAEGERLPEDEQRSLQRVLAQIRARTGRDFSRYKPSTVLRRIGRRMQLQEVPSLEEYLEELRATPTEVQALSDELLINVTEFFRDPEVFEELEQHIVPRLFDHKGPDDRVRVWSVGCATGEEAYSLAILLLEAAARYDTPPQLQVFASDLHEHSLARAREGLYPDTIESVVKQERLRRFFVRENGGYRVRKEVRETVVFTPHNLLSDPPFSRLDLVACRNVLIYLQRDIQRDVIDLFHYALNPEGYLVLGTSETIDRSEYFRTESKELCIFRKRNVPTKEPRLPVFPVSLSPGGRRLGGRPEKPAEPMSYAAVHVEMIEQYAPPSILVSPEDEVVHLSTQSGVYLQPPGGLPTSNAIKLVREELRLELRAALHDAREQRAPVRTKPVVLPLPHGPREVSLDVRPATDGTRDGFVLVIFDDRESASLAPATVSPTADITLRELEAELEINRQRLQAVVEEYDTSQEEMRASNEELQSMNEELRSTMEELETSKEELQSVNEELVTVNQENRHKVEELSQIASDLQNLMSATDIATLFLDRDLRILRFTPRVGELFNIRAMDRGRPLGDLTHRLGSTDLLEDARRVLARLVPVEREVRSEVGEWYLTRVLPYRSNDDRIEGVVITFVDITQRKADEEARARLHLTLEQRVQERTRDVREVLSYEARAGLAERIQLSRRIRDRILLPLRGVDGVLEESGAGESVRTLVADAAATAEALAAELELADPGDGDLAEGLQRLAVRARAARGGEVEVALAPEAAGAVDEAARLLLLRAVRELLSSQGTELATGSLRIAGRTEDGQIVLTVSAADGSLGAGRRLAEAGADDPLQVLRHRLRIFGGDLAADGQASAEGWKVTLPTVRED